MDTKHNPESGSLAKALGERIVDLLGGSGPNGLLGVAWGDDADGVAARLGLNGNWYPWQGGEEFEACSDTEHPVSAYESQAFVKLIRKDGHLVAISLQFERCGASREALIDTVGKQYHMTTTVDTPYKVFGDRSVVRLSYDKAHDTCELMVTGPEFGKAYAAWLTESSLRGLVAGFGPR